MNRLPGCCKLNLGFYRDFSETSYTDDAFYLHMWSYIELSVAVVVACLPAARQLWRHLIPKFLRLVGLGSPAYQSHDPQVSSTKRLKNILFISTGQDKPIPMRGNEFASYVTQSS